MADRMYLLIALAIVALIAADQMLDEGRVTLFLVQKLFHLVDYLEFWR
ncbi:MAG: hypothetical protein ABI832_01970 [bacterium]